MINGQEVMLILKQTHTWSGPEYQGMRGDGNEVWHMKLEQTWHTKYRKLRFIVLVWDANANNEIELCVDGLSASNHLDVQNKIRGTDKSILLNGEPAVTINRHETWKHVHRMDIINVAPGMDTLLALSVADSGR
jgi:hypothetical protein